MRGSRPSLEQGDNAKGSFDALLQVYTHNSFEVFADITSVFADMRVPVHAMNSKVTANDTMIINLTISCRNTAHVNTIISRIKKVKNVIDVTRGFSS